MIELKIKKPNRPHLIYRDKLRDSKLYMKDRINYGYFNIFKEFPLLIRVNALYANKSKPIENPKSILIINTSLIGDFVVSLPALRYFIDKHNGAKIDMVVAPPLLDLSKSIKGLNKVLTMKTIFNKPDARDIAYLDLSPEYDYVLIMRLPNKILQLLNRIEFKSIRTYLGTYLKLGMNMFGAAAGKEHLKQLTEVNFEIVGEENLNINKLELNKMFDFSAQDLDNIKSHSIFKQTENTKRIVIHTGSGWEIKFWNNKKWIELIKKLHSEDNYSFIFVGSGEQEEKSFKEISAALDFPVYSLIKKMNIKSLLMALPFFDLFIGIDSGPRHLAHLANLKSISLLGPGPKSFEPINENATILDKSKCACTNLVCFMNYTCMDLIEIEHVIEEVRKKFEQ